MKATTDQIQNIKSRLDRVGQSFDGTILDDELYNQSIGGAIRSWDCPKETIDQDRETIMRVKTRIKDAIERALSPYDVVEIITVYHGDKNYFDFQIKLK